MKFEKFFGTSYFSEHLQWLLLTVSDFQPAILIKKRFWQRYFSLNFAKFLRTSLDRTPLNDCFLSSEVVVRCSVKKIFLKILQNSQEKNMCRSLFFNKIADLRPATLLKRDSWHMSFAKFVRTPFL